MILKAIGVIAIVCWLWRVIRALGEFAWLSSEPDLYALDQNGRIARGEYPFGSR